RLQTAKQITRALTFLNTGPEQIPGLIVMRLTDADGLDPQYAQIVVLFNARPEAVSFADDSFAGQAFELHARQQNSVDAVVQTAAFDAAGGAFTVPGRTAAVFVLREAAPELTATAIQPSAVTSARAATPSPLPKGGQGGNRPARSTSGGLLVGLAAIGLAVLFGALWLWRRRKGK
ncbi:MAG: DUF3372 domain-containing protein, partial [Chloroflexi bacterium HGW-Chloroflexi-1]